MYFLKKLIFLSFLIVCFIFPTYSSSLSSDSEPIMISKKLYQDITAYIPTDEREKFVERARQEANLKLEKKEVVLVLPSIFPHGIEEELFISKFENVRNLIFKDENYEENLIRIIKLSDNHYKFGCETYNNNSFRNWLITLRIFKILSLSDKKSKEFKKRLNKEIHSKKRFLENIDFYICGDESKIKEVYPIYLEGIWNQVACFDDAERLLLIKSYKKGNIFPKNKNKIKYWNNYVL